AGQGQRPGPRHRARAGRGPRRPYRGGGGRGRRSFSCNAAAPFGACVGRRCVKNATQQLHDSRREEVRVMANENPKVLLIDDDKDLLQLIAMRLTAAGYAVTAVESGEAALASLAVTRPQVVVTDLKMQGMDGMALFDAIHRDSPSLPVLILTAHGTIPEAVAATRRGIFSFLTKPFEPKVLLDSVAEAMRLSSPSLGDAAEWRAEMITRSSAMEDLLAQARRVAASDASVCIF